ncbi:hypothetical protein Tco_0442917 [Tanacetum coccineum]
MRGQYADSFLSVWDIVLGLSPYWLNFIEKFQHLVHAPVASLYYCKVGTPLRVGITSLKNDVNVDDFVNLDYQNKWVVDLYVEHNGYDALDIRDQAETLVHDEGNKSSDAYCSSDDEDLGFVDFHTEADDNVVVKTLTTNDPFLNKLCYNNGHFRGFIDEPVNANVERVVEDTESIDPEFNVKDVETGRCVGYNTKKRKAQKSYFLLSLMIKNLMMVQKSVKKKSCVKGNFVITKSKENNGEGTSKSPHTTTKSPQTTTKSSYTTTKSPQTTTKSPQTTGGLKEHYRSLWEYRQAILDLNLGSTCRLDDEETSSGNNYFRRIDVCFKGVRDGWLAGCRKMYPIAWAVVKVENNENWCWFLALLHDDLNLQQGN